MFPHIDAHDFDIKVKSAIKFLQEGDKVKVTIAFKGREITHPEFGRQQMERIVQAANEVGANVEKPPAMEGRQMIMILSPKSSAGVKPTKPVVPGPQGAPAPRPAAPPQQPAAPSAE
jgi:translation initiation factor IF-3